MLFELLYFPLAHKEGTLKNKEDFSGYIPNVPIEDKIVQVWLI